MRISPINLKILAYTLDVEGHDSVRALQQCGLPPNDEIDENGDWIHVDLFDRLMAAALDVTADPCFGLIAGKSLALMRYGAIAPVIMASPHLRQMLADIWHLGHLSVERPEIQLDDTGPRARLLIQPIVQGGASRHFRTEQIATSAVQMLRFACATTADIDEVALPYPEPSGNVHRYAATFGPRIVYQRRHCSITFNPALLDAPLSTHDPVAYTAAMARAEALLRAMQAGSDLAEQVREVLLGALPEALSVADTAARVGLNERQMRRQLAALGTSHAELMQQCQRLKAERLMADGRMPIKQVADELGFGSVHSFHRAFKRWYGVTPSSWKQG